MQMRNDSWQTKVIYDNGKIPEKFISLIETFKVCVYWIKWEMKKL